MIDLGVYLRCQQLGIKTKRTGFSENVGALITHGSNVKLDKTRWDAIRELRNSTSHPKRQMIIDPGQTQVLLVTAVELLNDLFP